ncbi:hypothetical protein B0A48_03643 [Cryoendolithus antarcticus]|uniref:Tat pathway signal sequence n=1 Tax=Cryoendolithus antarcticus TaxID=1507870 RepID=A0A1V8TKL6_9PEZI|nr:hypothetical protein B0A48_03643 [Cryoendolithus antarcticus]
MPFPLSFQSTVPPSQDHSSSLRLPAQKRISIPNAHRLNAITEGPRPANAPGPAFQPRSILHNSLSSSQAASTRTAPPPYTWEAEPHAGENGLAPVEGDKLAELRRKEGFKDVKRGGWGRFALIALGVLAIIALAVGLGVGLTVGKKKTQQAASSAEGSSGGQSTGASSGTGSQQQFPLGEWSFVTALQTVATNCTSNAATWNCYPYHVFDASNAATNSSSLTTFNWVISNTSDFYALNGTQTTSEVGIPANLSISSTNNPFALSFTDVSLSYVAPAGNESSPRYTFSFSLPKTVVPSPSISSDNTASQCFFNNTVLSGALYLHVNRSFFGGDQATSNAPGSDTNWPYAVEISQTSMGGQGVPDCYETVNGQTGKPIVSGLDSQPTSEECICQYRNY